MIVPMKKVSLVVLDETKKEALTKLRSLGLVHLEQLTGSGNTLTELKETRNKLESIKLLLSDIKVDKKKIQEKSFTNEQVLVKVNELTDLCALKKNYEDELVSFGKELERLSAWGGMDPSEFEFLNSKGIILKPYECSPAYYNNISESVKTIFVNADKSTVRFLVMQDSLDEEIELSKEAIPVNLPEISTREISENCVKSRKEITIINSEIKKAVIYLDSINKTIAKFDKDIEFENTFTGMATDASEENNAKLAWLTGYIPSEDFKAFKDLAQNNNWAFVVDDPSEEDEVPTKLKNNKFVSLIYPVSDFLGTVPGYREYDISNWFLLFFCIFFGMIFGDGGYGLLLLIASVFGIFSSLLKKKTPGPAMFLLMLLGLATTVWGALTCNWFGIAPEKLPQVIKPLLLSVDWNFISNASTLPANIVKQNLQIFCFSLALVQLSIAHIKGIIRNIKSPKVLGDLGSLILLWGIFYLVLNMVVDGQRFALTNTIFGQPISYFMFAFIGGGFLLSFIFSNYEGNLLKSILESVKNIISVLLGVVNYFSDIVSYIRLWAVGLAGSAISQTVNQMAGPTLGGALIFCVILLLFFGHGLNMILNVLSVIVHGVRLNTLEFSSHLNMSWSGFSYKPFAEK